MSFCMQGKQQSDIYREGLITHHLKGFPKQDGIVRIDIKTHSVLL